jgi:ribose transport system permease protein
MTDVPSPRRHWPLPPASVLALVLVVAVFTLLIGINEGGEGVRDFLSLRNLRVIANEQAIVGVVGLGSLLIIISGGIDLSVGSVVALVTVVTMQVYRVLYEHHGSIAQASLVAVPAGVLTGGLCGLVNGLVITRLRVSPFVATLGMMGIARGVALYLANRTDVAFPGGVTPGWVKAAKQVHSEYTIFSPSFWSLLLLAGVVAVLLRWLILGRYCYAIGSSEPTARACGIAVDRTKVVLYVLAGLLTGWAGILSFVQIGGSPTSNQGLELDVIAAVVVGGASLSGGQGTVGGTLVGVFLLGLLVNGVRFLGVAVDYRYILIGAVIILSTALSLWRNRVREASP